MFDLRDVIVLARDASMSSSYKPALLKALTRVAAANPGPEIPLEAIGAEFIRLYWNQTIIFHLRQASTISKEPEILQAIRAASVENAARKLSDLPPEAKRKLVRKTSSLLKINVLHAFHTSKPANMPKLFDWDGKSAHVSLSDGSLNFLLSNTMALEMVANHWWAHYLEKTNMLAPCIIEKVQLDGARRSSLARFLQILTTSDELECFYCGEPLSQAPAVHVDHVLPWSFLLSDPIWDLVLACRPCNISKSDSLPSRGFIEKLVQVNVRRSKAGARFDRFSPLIDGADLSRLYEAAIAVEWPGPWSPHPRS